jgi:hypothetical protein
MESHLVSINRLSKSAGPAAAVQEARERALPISGPPGNEQVRIYVESARGADRAGAVAAVRAAGGRVEAEYADLVQALVPISALDGLANSPEVRYVRPPDIGVPAAVTDEAAQSSGASTWQSIGWSGAGVKVGIIDLGFKDYAARQASGDLPASLITQDYCNGNLNTATEHGTAVAANTYKMAPGIQLYLICIETTVNLGQAKDYAIAQGIRIINHSVSWFNTSRGDGSGGPGSPDAIVADARANGILWVNSAGNYQQMHWSGNFADTDNNGWQNFAANDEGNTFYLPATGQVCASLKWDDWPASSNDYDLYLVQSSDGTVVASSQDQQSGTQAPVESACYTNSTGTSQNFYVAIYKYSATVAPRFDLFVRGDVTLLQYAVGAGSLGEPASSPNAVAVGAICWQNDSLEPYSSLGPNIAGLTKPDIAGPDSTSSPVYGTFTTCGASGFFGTSSAAPQVAGAAALVLQANPGYTPAQLQSFLEGRAVDLGAAGKDNSFGAGKLALGAPPSQIAQVVAHPLSAVADGSEVAVFGRNSWSQIWYRETGGNGATWSGWILLTGDAASRPEAVLAGSDLYIFFRGTGNDLRYVRRHNGVWESVQSLGGTIIGHPVATVDGDGDVLVAALNPYLNTWYQRLSGGNWSGWQNLGGTLTGELDLTTYNGDAYLFGINLTGQTWVRHWQHSSDSWENWFGLDGVLDQGPAAAAYGGSLYVFGVNTAGELWYRTLIGNIWDGWQVLSGLLSAPPGAAATTDRLIVADTNPYGNVWDRQLSSGWSGWEGLDGVVVTGPDVVAVGNQIYLFVVNQYGNTWYRKWNGSSWDGWTPLSGILATDGQ